MSKITTAVRWAGLGAAAAAGAYAGLVGLTWYRYGRARAPRREESDALLDRFMPDYEAVERHHTRVNAPAAVTFAAACDMDLQDSPVIRAIFRTRQLVMGGRAADDASLPRAIVPQMKANGWTVLAQTGREIVFGAATQPWLADVVFRPIPPREFAGFAEPDYVKIVWMLRADPIGANESIFRTETRVAATDADARAKFRKYWAFVSPGVSLIRWLTLGPLKAEAERRAVA